jgi:hypothetical protein
VLLHCFARLLVFGAFLIELGFGGINLFDEVPHLFLGEVADTGLTLAERACCSSCGSNFCASRE